VSGQVKKVRHHDYVLSEAEKARGYALMCSNTAVTDLVIEANEAGRPADIPLQHVSARVQRLERLADGALLRLQLLMPRANRLRFLAGQSATLEIGGLSEDFPIASCPCDERHLEFHVRAADATPLTDYVFRSLKTSDLVMVEGPMGEFVLREDSPHPLLFVACETGFAPIKSLIEHAMALEAAEAIHLYWIATAAGGHYLQNQCRAWADALDDFYFTPLLAAGDYGAALGLIVATHAKLAELDVYAAGPQDFLAAAQNHLLSHGLPASQFVAQVTR
jgi:CDP-4-dehydro-6-deoxyglucose reductase